MANLIPSDYKVTVDIDDADIFKIGLAVYIAIIGLQLFKRMK